MMETLTLYYDASYVAAADEFDTTRKPRWIYEAFAHEPLPGLRWRRPRAAGPTLLARVHDRAYVDAVRTGRPAGAAASAGFAWDPGLYRAAAAMAGGLVCAVETALAQGVAGSLSCGQHHARRAEGAGFCTFNGIALAALRALDAGARRVLIVDLDAHCAGGTRALLAEEPRVWQLDLATHPFDAYDPGPHGTLDVIACAEDYLDVLDARLAALASEPFDVCLYYAGMDPYEGCPLGGLRGMGRGVLAQRERRVFSWCRGRGLPVAFGIGGGYTAHHCPRGTLTGLHRLTVEAALEGAFSMKRFPTAFVPRQSGAIAGA